MPEFTEPIRLVAAVCTLLCHIRQNFTSGLLSWLPAMPLLRDELTKGER